MNTRRWSFRVGAILSSLLSVSFVPLSACSNVETTFTAPDAGVDAADAGGMECNVMTGPGPDWSHNNMEYVCEPPLICGFYDAWSCCDPSDPECVPECQPGVDAGPCYPPGSH
jgi:hypothetical protein